MRVGFIGLGNIGSKLAMSLVRHGFEVTVLDLRSEAMAPLIAAGAFSGTSPRAVGVRNDLIITCLPSPSASAAVMEGPDGVIAGLAPGKIWAEMSTTDHSELQRLAELVEERGAAAVDCPVSGGCHRAATANISIFAGCDRPTFERILPILMTMGRQILHTGPIGTASVLKVMTNYLATANLVALSEALVTAKQAGLDLATTYEAIRISSGNSFVHETESQVILNGSRKIDFTMDLLLKDVSLFQHIAENSGVELELSPLLVSMVEDAIVRFGPREWSSNIIRRLEEPLGISVTTPGFPEELVDTEPRGEALEVIPASRGI